MQTPASIYVCSPRIYPGRVREPEYGSGFHVRRVQKEGQFRWKSDRVFLGTVLQGERVGLLPIDDRYFTVYFAEFPLALFDSRGRKILSLAQAKEFEIDAAGEGDASPSPTPHPSPRSRGNAKPKCQECPRSKMSGISPAAQ
jgi:hypothetical protein